MWNLGLLLLSVALLTRPSINKAHILSYLKKDVENVCLVSAGWFKGVKAMITIGLIGLVICMVFISLYMCVHSISKNTTIIIFVVVAFIAGKTEGRRGERDGKG